MDLKNNIKEKFCALDFAMELAVLLLEAGAETYRVEDTVERVLKAHGIGLGEVFAIPTGIFISYKINEKRGTLFERTKSSSINLELIQRANDISRNFTSGIIGVNEAMAAIADAKNLATGAKFSKISFLGSCAGSGFSVFLFGGTFLDFVLAFVAGAITTYGVNLLSKYEVNFFMNNLFGGFMAAMSGVLLSSAAGIFGMPIKAHLAVIGPLMTLVPGVAITNGMRDIISGDLVAGGARIMEAVFIAIALAFGVGATLHLAINFIEI